MKWLISLGVALAASGCCATLQHSVDQCNDDYRSCTRNLVQCQAGNGAPPEAGKRGMTAHCPPSVSPDVLGDHIRANGWDYDRKDDFFVIAVAGASETHRLVLHAAEGDQLNIIAPDIGTVAIDNQTRERMLINLMMLSYMMNLNFDHQFVKYGWDSSDGDVWAVVTLPLEDGITAETLNVYVTFLVKVLEKDNVTGLLSGLSELSESEIQELFRSTGSDGGVFPF